MKSGARDFGPLSIGQHRRVDSEQELMKLVTGMIADQRLRRSQDAANQAKELAQTAIESVAKVAPRRPDHPKK
jgi:hypothetical protein